MGELKVLRPRTWVAAVLLGGLLALATTRRWWAAPPATPTSPEPASEPSPRKAWAAPPRAELLGPIAERNIFDASPPHDAGETLETELPYVLLATAVTVPSTANSSAMIAEDTREARSMGYAVGDELAPGVTIAQIRKGRVTLRREDGRVEVLTLAQPGARDGRSASGKVIVRRAGRDTYEVSDAALARVYEDPGAVLDAARAKAYRTEGVQLRRVTTKSPLRALGLRSGDRVEAVDGREVRSVDELESALRGLDRGRELTIELSRNRKHKTLRYSVL